MALATAVARVPHVSVLSATRIMPTLNWIGRKAVENHHRQVPFHLLKDVPDLSVGDPGSGNLLVEGDNLLALKALLAPLVHRAPLV